MLLAHGSTFSRKGASGKFGAVHCDDGAEHWSTLASFIKTCKLNQVNAESWLADVLTKLVNGWPEAKLEELLPCAGAYTKRSARELNQKQAA